MGPQGKEQAGRQRTGQMEGGTDQVNAARRHCLAELGQYLHGFNNAYLRYPFETGIDAMTSCVGLFLFGEQGVYRLVFSPSL